MKIKVVGVPEHFNLPWKLSVAEKNFPQNLDILWTDEPSGTGAMCKSLRDGTTDLAVVLTEGIVLDIEKGNPSTILDIFVTSPLIWGIHTAADRKETNLQDFSNPKYAISRFQSGSHLMPQLESSQRNQTISESQWNQIHNLNGAIQSLKNHESDIFFWEKFMTSPWVEKNILKRIGEFPTPWPSFVIVARNDFLKSHGAEIQNILQVVRARAEKLQHDPTLPSIVSKQFGLSETSAASWVKAIQWNFQPTSAEELIKIKNNVINSIC
ncbi:MAG: ABC transporter substrate-binding protein [Proteobacteria bacterium]|jgi:ABC-type nitrate/sulfonate/bicarbonate transport system substrate-binding protein|nr:ABC transporter substrate-binding protein [Pseudomonadota bacterium]